jgi:hypothetical protein
MTIANEKREKEKEIVCVFVSEWERERDCVFVNMCMREGERERELMRKVGLKACPSLFPSFFLTDQISLLSLMRLEASRSARKVTPNSHESEDHHLFTFASTEITFLSTTNRPK